MPSKGLALTIGLNSVNPAHYSGWSGDLVACEADAQDMTSIAKANGFKVTMLLTKSGTRARVVKEIKSAATRLKSGDMFVLSYSGHGGQLPDLNADETDAEDETWCLYDGEQVDDELYALLGRFAKGVRILVFSDSCHSGTVTKQAHTRNLHVGRSALTGSEVMRFRNMPPDAALRTYRQNKKFYDKILTDPSLKTARSKIAASVLLVSGCQDNQLSQDGQFNGLFTGTMMRVWKEGAFKGDYKRLHKSIVGLMPPDQTPNYYFIGAANTKFEAQKPFSI
ncbi:MAG: caspase family protein [Acidobacteria bacterium]|nr:caspase family protein [Acidobacteriota bacterium]